MNNAERMPKPALAAADPPAAGQARLLRVKVWRRLQALGAVAVKNAVYALPAGEQAQEDFEWLAKEIVEARRRGD